MFPISLILIIIPLMKAIIMAVIMYLSKLKLTVITGVKDIFIKII